MRKLNLQERITGQHRELDALGRAHDERNDWDPLGARELYLRWRAKLDYIARLERQRKQEASN